MDEKEQEQERLRALIGDSRYIPFFHRITEDWKSVTVKWIGNFLLAVIDFLNLPAFVLAALFFIQQVMQLRDSHFSLPLNSLEFLMWLFGGWLLLRFLLEKTLKNMTSPTVLPVWFMNSKGVLKNIFFSNEKARTYSNNLDTFVQSQADEYIRQQVRETEEMNRKLRDLVSRMNELSDFPNETYESLGRTVEFIADAVIDPDNPRHLFQNVMDRIMQEIATTKPIQKYIKHGSIMVLDDDGYLRIAGHLYLPNSELSKQVRYGQRFAGKVLEEGKWVWVEDVEDERSMKDYDFLPNADRTYKGIFGFPFASEQFRGVICLHFSEVRWQEAETDVIAKTLEVYAEVVVTAMKLHRFVARLKEQYGIISSKETAGGA